MYNRSKILALAVIVMIPVSVILAPIPQANAQFVISSWVATDEYGQGLSVVYMHENSTGAWLPFTSPAFLYSYDPNVVSIIATPNTSLRVGPTFTLNHSLYTIPNIDAGITIMRSNVSVHLLGELIFSENNITIVSGGNQTATTYWYYAYCILDFLIVVGEMYEVIITFEIYNIYY